MYLVTLCHTSLPEKFWLIYIYPGFLTFWMSLGSWSFLWSLPPCSILQHVLYNRNSNPCSHSSSPMTICIFPWQFCVSSEHTALLTVHRRMLTEPPHIILCLFYKKHLCRTYVNISISLGNLQIIYSI